MKNKMYQVSTLQALALGYSRKVISAGELLQEGDTGLGTFEDVNGEMIVMDGHCYRADQDGNVTVVARETGVPFAAVAKLYGEQQFPLKYMPDITLKEVLGQTQKAFLFENIRGSLVGVYFPDYMDGINMPGWHLHFLSEDRLKGGHVFDVCIREGRAKVDKISNIFINLPKETAFDTYSLKQDLQDEIKSVE